MTREVLIQSVQKAAKNFCRPDSSHTTFKAIIKGKKQFFCGELLEYIPSIIFDYDQNRTPTEIIQEADPDIKTPPGYLLIDPYQFDK